MFFFHLIFKVCPNKLAESALTLIIFETSPVVSFNLKTFSESFDFPLYMSFPIYGSFIAFLRIFDFSAWK